MGHVKCLWVACPQIFEDAVAWTVGLYRSYSISYLVEHSPGLPVRSEGLLLLGRILGGLSSALPAKRFYVNQDLGIQILCIDYDEVLASCTL